MQFSIRSAAVLVAGILGLAACSDSRAPVEPGTLLPPGGPTPNSSPLVCEGRVSEAELVCTRPESPQGGPSLALVIGEQGTYVQVTSSNVSVVADTFAFDVTVQNLIQQAMGTLDGTTPHPDGVQVFFHVLPTVTAGSGTIEVANPTGLGTFTQTNQPYFQYDGILPPDSVTSPLNWRLRFDPEVEAFAFTLFVSTEVEHTENWVDLPDTTTFVPAGETFGIDAVVRTRVGRIVPDAAITWSLSDSSIAAIDSDGVLTALSPGRVTIFAAHGSDVAETTVDVCAKLQVGEVFTAEGPLADSLCLGGQDVDTEYTYIPVNPSLTSGLSFSTFATGTQGVTGPPTPFRAPSAGAEGLTFAGLSSPSTHLASLEADRRIVQSNRPAANLSTTRPSSGPSRVIVPGVPAVGDIWALNVAAGCTGTPDIRGARVRSVGTHVILVSDTLNPAGGFTQAQYDSISLELDSIAVPTITSNFGNPTDLDGNSRIVVFFTAAVNALSPPGAAAVSGRFEARDLFLSGGPDGCSRSNEGEIIYMLVPDPTGAVNSNVRTLSSVRGTTVRAFGHELQHLINASRRIHVLGTSLEEPWLDEGLSYIAEELMFYRTSFGLAPGQNIVVSDLTSGPFASRRVAAYNTYAARNMAGTRPWLQRSDTTGAFRTNSTAATHGALWAFLRYSADRALPGPEQGAFWSSLINTSTGMDNLASVIGDDPMNWYRDLVTAMYADDAVPTASEYTMPSWNFRAFHNLLYGSYSLTARPIDPNQTYTIFYASGGGTAFIRFGVAAGAFGRVSATSGGAPPVAPYLLSVIRTR